MNKLFSVLTRGTGTLRRTGDHYVRSAHVVRVHDVLVPPDAVSPFLDYAAEQLVQCVRMSSKASVLEEADTENLYGHPLLFPRQDSWSSSVLPGYLSVTIMKDALNPSFSSSEYAVSVESSSQEIVIDGKSYPFDVSGGLSSAVSPDPGVTIRTRWPVPAGRHAGTVYVSVAFTRELAGLFSQIPEGFVKMRPELDGKNIPEKMAGIVMDVFSAQVKN